MHKRLKIVLSLLFVTGVAALLLPAKHYEGKTEEWMESVVPHELPGYHYQGPVKMDDRTYQILQPFGIVGRRYVGPDGRFYEITLIAGNSRKSFHDPQVCFSAQNWRLERSRLQWVNIPALGGKVPATVIAIRSSEQQGTTMYLYRTPFGFRHDPFYIPFDLALAKILMRDNVDAVFYRFIVSPASWKDENDVSGIQKDVEALTRFAESALQGVARQPGGEYFAVSTPKPSP